MGNFSNWSSQLPSGSSSIRDSDDQIRSHQSILEAALNEEHYFTSSSASSTGVHRPGSARPYYDVSSRVSTVADNVRMMITSDTSRLWVLGNNFRMPLGRSRRGVEAHLDSGSTNLVWVSYASTTSKTDGTSQAFAFPFASTPIVILTVQSSGGTQLTADLVDVNPNFFSARVWTPTGSLSSATLHYLAFGPVNISSLSG